MNQKYSYRAKVHSSNGFNVGAMFDGGKPRLKRASYKVGEIARLYGRIDGEEVRLDLCPNGLRTILVYANDERTAKRLARKISKVSCK